MKQRLQFLGTKVVFVDRGKFSIFCIDSEYNET